MLLSLRRPKPFHKQRNALLRFHLGPVTQLGLRLGNVRIRDRHVARLQGLTVNHRLFADRVFNQFNQPVQPDGLGFAEVKNLKEATDAIEERARNDLGMIGRNETFFQVADNPESPPKKETTSKPSSPSKEAAPVKP